MIINQFNCKLIEWLHDSELCLEINKTVLTAMNQFSFVLYIQVDFAQKRQNIFQNTWLQLRDRVH